MSNKSGRSVSTGREVCELCSKNILIGQTTILCKQCDSIFHARCTTPVNFEQFRDNSYCAGCILKNDIRRYNPFFSMFDDLDPDKFYENESAEFVESVEQQSKILEDCKNYTYKKLSELVNTDRDKYSNFSSLFMNIDGNKSNFDSFTTEVRSFIEWTINFPW